MSAWPCSGGWIAVLVTDATAIGFRVWLGGPVHAPWLGMVVASLVGIGFWRLQVWRKAKPGFAAFWILGMLISLANLALLPLGGAGAFQLLEVLVAPLLIINPLATAILGVALRREDERLALQRRLDEQTGLFEAIFDAMSDGVTVANAAGEIVMVNPKSFELAGTPPNTMPTGDWSTTFRVSRADRDEPLPDADMPLLKAVKGVSSDNVEIDVHNIRDNLRRTLSVSGRPLLDPDGGTRGGVVVFHDITAQRLAARELLKNETRLKEAISVMESGFGLFDAEDRLVLCNEAFIDEGSRRAFGTPVGRTFDEIVHAFAGGGLTAVAALADRDGWIRWRIATHRDPPIIPTELQFTDGSWKRFTERVTAEGGRVAIWTDITPLKQAEVRLRDAIENIDGGFALFDRELRFVTFNQRLLEQYPTSAAMVEIGARLEDVVRFGAEHGEYAGISTPAEAEAFVSRVLKSFSGERDASGEVALANGRWLLVNRHRTAEGGHVAIRTDITALKRQQKELEAANRKLQNHAAELAALATKLEEEKVRADAANREKSVFLAGMSHELRTPLNGILGFADMIGHEIYGPVTPPRYRDYADLIHQSGQHLLSLINDILDLSKIEAGKTELKIEALSPRQVAEAAVSLVARLARDRDVRLSVDIDPSCAALHADERACKQMIINLLSNAVKFTPPGGAVRLSITSGQGGGADITISDTGSGMTAAELRTALEVYGQVDRGTGIGVKGSGLGLPLTKAMAELHGGRLDIVSHKGAGTTATIHLPGASRRLRETA